MNQSKKGRKNHCFFTVGRQAFEAKSQSIRHMGVSMKTFEFTALTFLLILFEEDKSAYRMLCVFCCLFL